MTSKHLKSNENTRDIIHLHTLRIQIAIPIVMDHVWAVRPHPCQNLPTPLLRPVM